MAQDIDFDKLLNSYTKMINANNIPEININNYTNLEDDNSDNQEKKILIESAIDYHVKQILEAEFTGINYALPEDLEIDTILKILELVEKEKHNQQIKLDRELRQEQDREYEEALKVDVERELQKEKVEKVEKIEEITVNDKILSREELRQARLKFYRK